MSDIDKHEAGGQRRHGAPNDAPVVPAMSDVSSRHVPDGAGKLSGVPEDHSASHDAYVRAFETFENQIEILTGNRYGDYGEYFSGMLILSDAHLKNPVASAQGFCAAFGLTVIPDGSDPIEIDQIGVMNRCLACVYAYAQDSGQWAIDGVGAVLSLRKDGGLDRLGIEYDDSKSLPFFVLSRSLNPGDKALELFNDTKRFASMNRIMKWSDAAMSQPFVEVARGHDIGVIAPYIGVTPRMETVPAVKPEPVSSRNSGPSGP